jgi:glutamyl-tRNA reductase
MVLAELAWALTNKFTHAPTDALKSADQDDKAGLLAAARKLFRLDDD